MAPWDTFVRHLRGRIGSSRAFSSATYWQERYATGGTSGPGSYGRLAQFKAEVINDFVRDNPVQSVVEFGCGDGNQLSLYTLPRYVGLDVSQTSIALCKERFSDDPSKTFLHFDSAQQATKPAPRADLAMSIDVIFHLTEDQVFESYMRAVFASGTRFVIIYATNTDHNRWFQATHVKHRKFTDWVEANAPDWALRDVVKNKYPLTKNNKTESSADFFVYSRGASIRAGSP